MRERVQGKCPGCGRTGFLFLGSGGYPTCSIAECPDPCAAADLLLGEKKPVLSPAELVGAMMVYLTANGWEQRGIAWFDNEHKWGLPFRNAVAVQFRRDGVDVTG